MSSFSVAVKPVIERPSHLPADEEAVDLSESIDYTAPPSRQARKISTSADNGGTYELHPLPGYFTERARRPSVLRNDSTADTITLKDLVPEQSLPVLEDAHLKSRIATVTSTGVAIPTVHHRAQIVESERSKSYQRQANLQFAALCWCFFLEGWNDGTTGPLIPVIQESYHINFAIVSLLFVFNCSGFILGAGTNIYLNERYGLGKIMFIGSLFQVVSYAVESPQPPFPVMVMAYALAGFGMSLQNAQGNGLIGSLKEHKTTKLNMLHAAYGVGAFISPLVATHFSYERHWSYHFIISTGIAVSNSVVLALVFRFKTQEVLLTEAGQAPGESDAAGSRGANLYSSILNIKAVHFLAVFALIYIGTEVTLGGWIVTFIINEREGGKSAGYVSSGFFGGLTLGRLSLIWFSKKVGEHRVVFVYTLLAIALELTVWFVPSIIENGVAISFVGLLLGPMFPILVGHATRILPARLLTESVGWITGIGMSGSAALPFVTGLLASRYGIRSLQPLVVSMMCTLVGVWALVPRARRVD
ncbi:MFS general substrate transporter [Armillaria gallica]|uniref:MFS general substrate transporter n=1 Tax=Armillaria gallica TaxID=47427 RepID=A0A2H3EAE1_ARMGA|nr:MFS general substrate transporter [Armillaria gallica]